MTKLKRHPRPKLTSANRASKVQTRKLAQKGKRQRGPVLRVLPLLILVALFVLGFRVTVVVQDVQTLMASVDVGQPSAFAQEQADAEPLQGVDGVADETASQSIEGDAEAITSAGELDEETDLLANSDSESATFNADPQSFTPSELELLQRLSERRKVIEAQAQELQTREAMLQAAEARIDGKISELQQLEQTLMELVAEADAQQQQKTQQLVRIYGAMKPKDAARIFNDLDMPILLTVVENMKENKVAPILSQMDAIKATAVTEALSARKRLPGIEGQPQG